MEDLASCEESQGGEWQRHDSAWWVALHRSARDWAALQEQPAHRGPCMHRAYMQQWMYIDPVSILAVPYA